VRRLKRLHDLSACIGAPGPHDFAVRDHIARLVMCRVHRIPALNVRDDREAPLLRARDTTRKPWNQTNAKPLFFARGLDDPNQLEVIGEIRFLAQGIRTDSDCARSNKENDFARRATAYQRARDTARPRG